MELADNGIWSTEQYPAAGRALPGWEAEATAAVADNMASLGCTVLDVLPVDEIASEAESPTGSPVIGGVAVRWHVERVVCVVRIDAAAECYPR
ncbi:MAG: hypothetical protein R2733_17205 [Acidimicrobiales bacterium]